MLIFRSSRSQIFFEIAGLKSFAILEPLLIKLQAFFYRTPTVTVSGPSLQNYVFQLDLVFSKESRIGFCPGLLWKYELNFIGSHCSSSVKKGVLRNFENFTGKRLLPEQVCSFTWSVLFNNLHFRLKFAHVLYLLNHNLQFRLPILPSLL